MTIYPLISVDDARAAAPEVVCCIGRGGVVVVPTETFYGLAADPLHAVAVERVRVLKGRPSDMDLPVLCGDWDQVDRLTCIADAHRSRLAKLWPGPLTVVVACRRPVAAAGGRTVAVRIPGLEPLRRLLLETGPLTGTSANRHGEPGCRVVGETLRSLLAAPDLVLDGGETAGGPATSVVDLTADPPRVLRSGSVRW